MEIMDTISPITKPKAGAHKITFPSLAENVALVEKLVDDICTEYDLSENNYGNILVAVTEAVNNAIYHGNNLNPEKIVKVVFAPREDTLIFTIEDEGKGFDFSNLPDPTSPENIEKPYGRGVFLMKNLSDEVRFSNSGRTVEISFLIGKN